MITVKVGVVYVTRSNTLFKITRELNENDLRYPYGYRFEGESFGEKGGFFKSTEKVFFRLNGQRFINGEASPYDLVEEYKKKPDSIKIADVIIGSVVADMNNHKTNSGQFRGWDVHSPFEIPANMFWSMLAKMPTEGNLIQNKMAYLVSITETSDNNVGSALVIYRYDHYYYCSCLFRTSN